MHRSGRLGQGRHSSRIDDNAALWAGAEAFTSDRLLIAERDVNHAALAAVHGIEAERCSRTLDFIGGCESAHPQLFDSERAIIVRIEGDP